MKMVNHPSRSRQSDEAAIRRLLKKHQLQKIEVAFHSRDVFLRAIPEAYGEVVRKRREAALEPRDYSLKEASEVYERVAREPVATAKAPTLTEGIMLLMVELDKGDACLARL
jgi:hypothetical protein